MHLSISSSDEIGGYASSITQNRLNHCMLLVVVNDDHSDRSRTGALSPL